MTGFFRRSQLVTPASSEKLLEKALKVDCDSLVIDLEDAVAPTFKHEARQVLRRALTDVAPGRRELCVRINGLETPWCLDDLLALEGLPIDAVVVPKVQRPEDLYVYDQLLRQLELRGGRSGLALLALIESAGGLENASSIARASHRCRALIFGVGDFIAQTGMAFDEQTLLPVRSRIVTAAAAAGVQAIDHVHPDVVDTEGLVRAAQAGKKLGFTSKWAIHPRQVAPVERVFSPDDDEVARARRTIAAYESAQREGRGAIIVDGLLVDEAVLKIAQRKLALAERTASGSEAEAS
jgi:citrate lyase subunit beta / citryl-CoA lyase